MLMWEVVKVRQRIGMIICVTGIILLFMPEIDVQLLLLQTAALAVTHWPAGLVLLGLILLRPRKGRKKS